MKLSLLVTQGKTEGRAIPITIPQFVIGRDPQCHLRPNSVSISKRHCSLVVLNGKVFARDLDSTNGTYINDEPLKGERELHDKDRLKLGPLTFIVRIENTAPINKPTPVPGKSKDMDDEAVAQMLLALQEESGEEAAAGRGVIPADTTVINLPAVGQLPDAPKEEEKKPEPAKPQASADTSSAAQAILNKYARRNRK